MAKRNGILVLGLIGVGGFLLFRQFNASAQKLTARVSRVKIKTSLKNIIGLKTADMDLTLEITNPTRINYEVESFTGQVLYNGLVVSDVNTNQPFTIAAGMITPAVLSFKVNTRQLIEQLASNQDNNQPGEQIKIMGMIKTTMGLQVPINQTVRITL